MRKSARLLLAVALTGVCCIVGLYAEAQSARPAGQRFSAERIRAHVKFLSSDLLEGRGTGQRGGDIAAEYIATQFALAGLKPAGENGGYLQKVPMVGITTDPGSTVSLVADGKTTNLRLGDDLVAMDETESPTS